MTTTTAHHPHVTIAKAWDDNERIREAPNGRVYVSTAGRWQWIVSVDNVVDSSHDRRRDAVDRRIAITTREAREARERLEREAAGRAELKPAADLAIYGDSAREQREGARLAAELEAERVK
jgi:molybdopterin-guanine dinucleotide biosynthesis protein